MHETSRQIISMLKQVSSQHSIREVFEDFCSMAVASYHNSIYTLYKYQCPDKYKPLVDKLESEYETITKKYPHNAIQQMSVVLAVLHTANKTEVCDYLGEIYMDLEIGNAARGQYFTPFHIAHLMAMMSSSKEEIISHIKTQGYMSFCDSCCGSGVMALAFIKAVKNDYMLPYYVPNLHIHLTDIDNFCVKMAYIQMCLMQVKARIVWGNTLTNEVYEIFDTPALQAEYTSEPVALGAKEKKQLTLF